MIKIKRCGNDITVFNLLISAKVILLESLASSFGYKRYIIHCPIKLFKEYILN